MFKKILIANRGEIACRVIKTAKKMGIATVAVYSDADRSSLHVKMADEAVYIGEATANASYLVMDKIIAACKTTGAEAIHPGYGFLSENPEFAARLDQENIIFIGPPKGAIEAMGDKITSKKLAQEAGVSTVPGHMGLIENADEAVKIASSIGYPVMIKASAGGGGKGMRIAWNDKDTREGFQSSKNEAANAFGDDRIFIEKFVTQPRHIEIQVLADKHGNCIYLGERECSIQRRNQKVIEEAPSPFLDEATRKAMGEESVALSKAVDYASAGTVEFIVDGDKNFYFLEMNTRLQVEHPVTELITGVDLVEQMIRIAWGEKLTLKQTDIKLNGWAMESRLYAEDPYRNFLPSIGRLTRYRPPHEGKHEDGTIIRNDTGVFEGGEISIYYDPMIAKLCTWGKDRITAIDAMGDAIDAFEVEGIGHNLAFLSTVMDHEKFRSGNITTAFIEEEFPDGFSGNEMSDEMEQYFIAISAIMHDIRERRAAMIEGGIIDATPAKKQELIVRLDGTYHALTLKRKKEGYKIILAHQDEQERLHITPYWAPGETLFRADINGREICMKISSGTTSTMRYRGCEVKAQVMRPSVAALSQHMIERTPPDTSKLLLCPMPGLVVSIAVSKGETVEEGQVLATLEAMKMENILRAERKGTVSKINASAGDSLSVDEIIMEFE
jgi:propionyl-CoA carboxylase alpha chain